MPQLPKAGDGGEHMQGEGVQVWTGSVSPTCRFPKSPYLNHSRNCMFSRGRAVLGMFDSDQEFKTAVFLPCGCHEPLLYLPQNPPCWHHFCRDTVRETDAKGLWSGLSFATAVCKISGTLCFENEVHTYKHAIKKCSYKKKKKKEKVKNKIKKFQPVVEHSEYFSPWQQCSNRWTGKKNQGWRKNKWSPHLKTPAGSDCSKQSFRIFWKVPEWCS